MAARGKRVRHPSYGLGSVVGVERGGLSLRVLFDKFPRLEVSLPSRALRLIEDEGAAPPSADQSARGAKGKASTANDRSARGASAPRVTAGASEGIGPAELSKRQTLEAVRLGVVPSEGLMAYTVGRDEELEIFRKSLASREDDRTLAVLGDYGTGKTHLLELMQRIAVEDNWIVGRAWLDPQEAPPSKPRRVYASLVRSLIYPDRVEAGECGLWPLLEKACVEEHASQLIGRDEKRHVFLGPALNYCQGLLDAYDREPESLALLELQTRLVDWIEGRATGISQELQRALHGRLDVRDRVLALSDFGTLPRVYGYLLSGIGSLARLCGYRGVLLLLDETELFSNLDPESRDRAIDVFKVLMSAALPEGVLDLEDVRKGGRGIIRELPPRFDETSGLALVLAATPGSASEGFLRTTLGDARTLELRLLSKGQFREMGDRILDLYLRAYPRTSRRVLAALEAKVESWLVRNPQSPREFGRRALDFLDQCRHTVVDFA